MDPTPPKSVQNFGGPHLDFAGKAREVKGELELEVGELAATDGGGIGADYRGRPLEQIHTPLQPQHLRRALDTDMKIH